MDALSLQSAPDRSGKGEFIDYYLRELREAEGPSGGRLVDYLDLHWYPEARGGDTRVIESSTAAETVAARVQAPRSLWDDTYVEDSWIIDATNGPIRLLPRIKQKIAANYPGTKLAITGWNYGAGNHISGAIATADVLGIFGREGVALATLFLARERPGRRVRAELGRARTTPGRSAHHDRDERFRLHARKQPSTQGV